MNQTHAQCFIFDFDGVIADTAILKIETFISLAGDIQSTLGDKLRLALNNELVGADRFAIGKWIEYQTSSRTIADKFLADFASAYDSQRSKCSLVKGASEFLELSRSKGILLAILSNAPMNDIREILRAHEITENIFADIAAFSEETKSQRLRSLMARLSASADRCIMFGDMISDYEAAKSNSMRFIRIQTNDLTPERWPADIEAHPDFLPLLSGRFD
jgi:phosphoglycolate phosphatase-like HAD superfamily hydrolase